MSLEITDIELPLSLRRFVELCWEEESFYRLFLGDIMTEKDVVVTPWHKMAAERIEKKKYERCITSQHPLPLQLPWLPVYVHSSLLQTLEYNDTNNVLRITETSTIRGLPLDLKPSVITEWDCIDLSPESCTCHITLRFEYEKPTWLQPMIEKNAHSELMKQYDEWKIYIDDKINKLRSAGKLHVCTGLLQLVDLLPDPKVLHAGFVSPDRLPERLRARASSYSIKYVSSSPNTSFGNNGIVTSPRLNYSNGVLTSPSTSVKSPSSNHGKHENSTDRRRSFSGGGGGGGSVGNLDGVSNSVVRRLVVHGSIFYQQILKLTIDGICEYGLFKLAGAILVNMYAKLDLVDFLGIHFGHTGRSLLDHLASVLLICCVIVIFEVISRGILSFLRPYFISSPTVVFGYVSRGTQTDDEDYDYLSIVGDDEATDNSFSDDNSTDSIDYSPYGGTWRNSGEKKNRRLFFSSQDSKSLKKKEE